MPSIVTENVSIIKAPTPNTLQRFGAIITQGGTNTAVGTQTLVSQASDLTAILKSPLNLSSLTWSANVVTATTSAPHNLPSGETIPITVLGAAPVLYNGTFAATVTGASTFTYALLTNPGSETTSGQWQPGAVNELIEQVDTFFAQSIAQSVYVFEFGVGNVSDGVTFLTNYLAQNPNSAYTPGAKGFFYIYLVPREWDANSAFLTLAGQFTATNSKTYFFVTTTLATYTAYPATLKSVLTMIESPAIGQWPANALSAISYSTGIVTATTTTNHGVLPGQWFQIAGCAPSGYNGWFQALPGTATNSILYALASNPGVESVLGTLVASYSLNGSVGALEFSLAAPFNAALSYSPTPSTPSRPFDYTFLYGVTPFPTRNLLSLNNTLNAANVNVVGTGAEGGISDAILVGGNYMDGNPFEFWYSVDWMQVNCDLNVSNAVINGNNNKSNPLFYDQAGINRLQKVIAATVNQGASSGLVLFPAVQTSLSPGDLAAAIDSGVYAGYSIVNAVPFASYVANNPSDYPAGLYKGFTITFTPKRGFVNITINIVASELAT